MQIGHDGERRKRPEEYGGMERGGVQEEQDVAENGRWLDDYALFMALKNAFDALRQEIADVTRRYGRISEA